jgi:uncharacterized protein (TIGR04255 family)
MPFPDSPRVIYADNPLVEVVCQLRFPPILRIDTEQPAAFQEKIRRAYPLFRENQITDLKLDLPKEIVQLSGGAFPALSQARRVGYDFISADEKWKVGLTREFIALSTTRYERWEDFKAHLIGPLQAFIEIYEPECFSRIGLRYRDLIRRSRLHLDNVPWAELLVPHIAGELCATDVVDHIFNAARMLQIRLPDNEGEVLIQHGLGLADTPEGETCYVIDCDFSLSARTEVNDAITKLDSFNRKSGRLFRWCITERLHRAMGPQPI